ncbi:MAG: HAMP domain-containing protein [Sinobacteraceae bacterium]|nr:HAMP domain-containing protein [Nevskiaceae bacterium]
MNRLSVRIFVAFFVTLLLVLAGAVGITTWTLNEREARATRELQAAAEQAAEALALRGRTGLINWAKKQRGDSSTAVVILVVDDLGQELLDRPLPPELPAANGADADEELTADLPIVGLNLPGSRPTLYSEDGEHFELIPVPRDRGPLAALGLRESAPALLLLALVVTALISGALARSLTGPIVDLQSTTESLAGGKLDSRVPARTLRRKDELGRFSRSLNTMAERLASLVNSRDELLRNVSHELRSPLTRMRLAIGLARQSAQPPADTLERIETETARLDGLIGGVLDVARLDSGRAELRREQIDLATLLASLVQDATFEAESTGRHVDWQVPTDPCLIEGDRQWVAAAIENVVRNALRYTPVGSTVKLRLERMTNTIDVVVSDSGAGIAPEDLSRVFEPFQRATSAASGSEGSSGLGLAITASVLRAHGGSVSAHNRKTQNGSVLGLEIRLCWPAEGSLQGV